MLLKNELTKIITIAVFITRTRKTSIFRHSCFFSSFPSLLVIPAKDRKQESISYNLFWTGVCQFISATTIYTVTAATSMILWDMIVCGAPFSSLQALRFAQDKFREGDPVLLLIAK
jgi:hypothetical protein